MKKVFSKKKYMKDMGFKSVNARHWSSRCDGVEVIGGFAIGTDGERYGVVNDWCEEVEEGNMIKVFSKEKFMKSGKQEELPENHWANDCDGVRVFDDGHMISKTGITYRCSDNWVIFKVAKKPGKIEHKKWTIRDFKEKKLDVTFDNDNEVSEFLNICADNGLVWNSGHEANKFRVFEHYDLHIHYNYHGCKALMYANSFEHLSEAGYEIVCFADMEKEVAPKYTITVECDGDDVTTAKMIINGKVVKIATAKRNPVDKFDFAVAAKVAFDRLFEKKKKIKVGDKVIVRNDLVVDRKYGVNVFVESMNKYKGKVLTVKEINGENFRCYESNGWNWTKEMIE